MEVVTIIQKGFLKFDFSSFFLRIFVLIIFFWSASLEACLYRSVSHFGIYFSCIFFFCPCCSSELTCCISTCRLSNIYCVTSVPPRYTILTFNNQVQIITFQCFRIKTFARWLSYVFIFVVSTYRSCWSVQRTTATLELTLSFE